MELFSNNKVKYRFCNWACYKQVGCYRWIDRALIFHASPGVHLFNVQKWYRASWKDLSESYVENAPNQDQKLAKAFENGFESLPILKKLFGEYFPRVNYSFRWDGLEQLSIFKNFATRVSLDHAYQSNYSRTFVGSVGGGEVTQSQRISYAFAPLAGLSISFKEVLKGTMSANVRYGSNVTYDLSPSSKNIVEAVGNDMSITGSFAKSGFEFLSLASVCKMILTLALRIRSQRTPEQPMMRKEKYSIQKELRVKDHLEHRWSREFDMFSARALLHRYFYRYTKIAPDEGGSRIPGSSTNEGGVDVHIAIQ